MQTLRIKSIERLKNSRNGNPSYYLKFEDGSTASTTPDSDYAYDIGNPGVRVGDLVEVEYASPGRIARIQGASVAS